MKKLLTLFALTLMTISLNAQKLDGTYVADEAFTKKVNSFVKDYPVNAGFQLWFLDNQINLIVTANVEVESMVLDIQVTIPGTYTRNGNQFTCDYNTENTDLALMHLSSTDPNISAMLESDEADSFYGMIESMLQEQAAPYLSTFNELSKAFNTFTIESETERGFTLIPNTGEIIHFTKL